LEWWKVLYSSHPPLVINWKTSIPHGFASSFPMICNYVHESIYFEENLLLPSLQTSFGSIIILYTPVFVAAIIVFAELVDDYNLKEEI
jgi:hypothetical protein